MRALPRKGVLFLTAKQLAKAIKPTLRAQSEGVAPSVVDASYLSLAGLQH